MKCPLCKSSNTHFFVKNTDRVYQKCSDCDLIFAPSCYFLNEIEEKIRYNLHENFIENIGYRNFLSQVISPIKQRLSKGTLGLDYGSGPSPVLATLLEIEGYKMDFYDPYYANNQSVFNKKYDFISLTEVAEHFYYPAIEFEKILQLLEPNGYLVVMTSRTDAITDFKNWYYQKDPTHVSFYSNKSFEFIASKYKLSISIIDAKIVILNK